jgi:methionyl-tRNA formyltransferase
VREGLPLFAQLLEAAAEGRERIPSKPQDLSRRRYFGTGVPNNGRIRWSTSAREVVDFVRACDYFPFPSPWGVPEARLDGQTLGVTKAARTGAAADAEAGSVGEADADGVRVAAQDEWVAVTRVHVEGKAQPAGEVLEPGMRFADD